MALTLVAARQLLQTLNKEHGFTSIYILVALSPVYNLPALSSDPILRTCRVGLSSRGI
jgi:hypothetical protein